MPWKYGFKGGKSIVKIRFTERQPRTTWSEMAPREYGFYANVNPTVDHPRWSQATERRIGELERRITLAFNGYAEDVAGLYAGMDLTEVLLMRAGTGTGKGTGTVRRERHRDGCASKARLTPWLGPGVLIGALVPLALLVIGALRAAGSAPTRSPSRSISSACSR